MTRGLRGAGPGVFPTPHPGAEVDDVATSDDVQVSENFDASVGSPTVGDLAGAVAALSSMVLALIVLPAKDRKGLRQDCEDLARLCKAWSDACTPPAGPAGG